MLIPTKNLLTREDGVCGADKGAAVKQGHKKKIIYLPTNNPFTLKFNTMKNLMQMY